MLSYRQAICKYVLEGIPQGALNDKNPFVGKKKYPKMF